MVCSTPNFTRPPAPRKGDRAQSTVPHPATVAGQGRDRFRCYFIASLADLAVFFAFF